LSKVRQFEVSTVQTLPPKFVHMSPKGKDI